MSNFIVKCLAGEALLDDIDDYIDEWHESGGRQPIHQFLGMDKREYSLWVSDPYVLPFIITAHHENRNLEDILEEFDPLPLAARSEGPHKAKDLMTWLKAEGLWE